MIFPHTSPRAIRDAVCAEEARYHAQIAACARTIKERRVRFVFLAGPSCSGKSTTALELEEALKREGRRLFSFSTDDFFFDQAKAPKNPDGSYNYDAFSHTDSALIISCLTSLAHGEITHLPTFDFLKSARSEITRRIDPREYDLFLLEGIHGLNRAILGAMPDSEPLYRLYLDVTETAASPSGKSVFPPERIRFCRRLIRDFKHRGASPDLTWALWRNVLTSEKEILHPFRQHADQILSTFFSYEPGVEKKELTPLLESVKPESPLFPEADALLRDLADFPEIPREWIPANSVLREFID